MTEATDEMTDEHTYQITLTQSDLHDLAFNESKEKFKELQKVALYKYLHDGVVELDFKKRDGTTRHMRCTLMEVLRPEYEGTSEQERAHDPDQIRVWDLDKEEWRSFKIDKIYPETVTLTPA